MYKLSVQGCVNYFFDRPRTLPVAGLFLLLGVVYLSGLFVPLMDNDSANHACIALHMLRSGDWCSLIDRGQPYLDKPHFQFWLVALSFKLFGVSGWVYKLSSLLFSVWGVWATYRLTALFASKFSARIASLLLASYAAFVLANNDVRMDAILCSASVLAVSYGLVWYREAKRYAALLCALSLAVAFGTKGWIGVFVPVCSLSGYLIAQRMSLGSWLRPTLVLMVLFFIGISPILYAYYCQFDLHPDLWIRGAAHRSGLKFILFDQVFERMGGGMGTTGTSDPFFYLHTLLWALLPWSGMCVIFIVRDIVGLFQRKSVSPCFAFCIPVLFLTLIAFSMSRFKLPHYINIVFPFIAIFTGERLSVLPEGRLLRSLAKLQAWVACIMLLGVGVLAFVVFPVTQVWGIFIVVTFGLVVALLCIRTTRGRERLVTSGVVASAYVWLFFNLYFYPQLLRYQAGTSMTQFIAYNHIPVNEIGCFETEDYSYSLCMGCQTLVPEWSISEIQDRTQCGRPTYLFLEENAYRKLLAAGFSLHILSEQNDYRITRLTLQFLNPDTRPRVLQKVRLVRIG